MDAPYRTSSNRTLTALARRARAGLDDHNAWLVAVVSIGTGVSLVGALWLLWLIVSSLVTSVGRWLAAGPVTRTITEPIHTYIGEHAQGLPASPVVLEWTWLIGAAVLFLAAWTGSQGGRIGWVLIGAGTAAMVWAGSPAGGRDLAAGLTVVIWSLLSIVALASGRPRIVVEHPVIEHHTAEYDETDPELARS